MPKASLNKELFRARAIRESERLERLDHVNVILSIASRKHPPEVITSRLELEPFIVRGDSVSQPEIECNESYNYNFLWEYHTSSFVNSKKIEDHLVWLLEEKLFDKRQAVRKLQEEGASTILYVKTTAWSTLLYAIFDATLMQKLAQFRFGLEIRTQFKNAKPRLE